MSNIIDIYNTLIRIEDNNHRAKRISIYPRKNKYYRLKTIELLNVIERIVNTKPKHITFSITSQIYKNIDCFLFKFIVYENEKYNLPKRIFYFHQPKFLFKGEKEKCIIRVINILKN